MYGMHCVCCVWVELVLVARPPYICIACIVGVACKPTYVPRRRTMNRAMLHATQVALAGEDTHLHASFQRLMEELEVKLLHRARKDEPDRVPKLSRQDIVDLVREVFMDISM